MFHKKNYTFVDVYLLNFSVLSVLLKKSRKNYLKFDTLCGAVNWNLDQITSLKDTKLFSAPANKFIKDLTFIVFPFIVSF